MLSGHLFPCPKSVSVYSHWFVFFIFIVLLVVGLGDSDHAGTNAAARDNINMESNSAKRPTTHINFFRSSSRGRQRILSCAKDPSVCLDDREKKKNPWGSSSSSTCCFQRFCKDTRSDPNHCGGCGKTCGFGFICCNGKCVDTQSDPQHCGGCFEICPGQTKCAYAMCDYGG